MNIYICDDDVFDRKITEDIIYQYCRKRNIQITVTGFENSKSMFAYNQTQNEGMEPEIVLIDIELQEENGIEIASRINQLRPDCQVIYLTNYLSYSLDVYDTKHEYYVLKDHQRTRLPDALDKTLQKYQTVHSSIFFHTIDNEEIRVKLDRIIYLERKVRITVIHLEDENLQIRDRITTLDDMLPDLIFSRCHNSFIVNLSKVKKKTGKTYLMENGDEIPISRKYKAETTNQFLLYNSFIMS